MNELEDNTIERMRLEAADRGEADWRLWGPYLSERQWSTVREDYSAQGSAWEYFPHDHARSRAYRWGEDGILGISDAQQQFCFAIALWNYRDPILKERLFGLTGNQGNHGEDVKELYYYLDATPTASYLCGLYKYPLREYPYTQLIEENQRRDKTQPEYELLDTGIFAQNEYVDVMVEYAKAEIDDILIRLTVTNRAASTAKLMLLPHLWFRNTWSWEPNAPRPVITKASDELLKARNTQGGEYVLAMDKPEEILFTENDTNVNRLYGLAATGPCKDAFHEYLIHHNAQALAAQPQGSKAGLVYRLELAPGQAQVVRLRLIGPREKPIHAREPLRRFKSMFEQRVEEAHQFYQQIQKDVSDPDARRVQRQAYAGMIWSKQFYHLDVERWLEGDPNQVPPPVQRKQGRNREWGHLNNQDILSMPDKWEYPWYAAWDLAFHCIPLARLDPTFAKQQLLLLTREWYMHPNGQLPAYEWAFGDVNPPVHAWASWRVFEIDRMLTGKPDSAFLERIFHKLMLNFTWWVNRKDTEGRNLFQGGFLGLDNIGVFDRSAPLPTGGHISQCDGTSWMAMYALNLMRISLELATHNPVYQDTATKFFEHFLHIAAAMGNVGGDGIDLWCKDDEFFYDVLCLPDGRRQPLKVRSMVGLIPMFAVEVLDPTTMAHVPEFRERLEWLLKAKPELAGLVSRWYQPGAGDSRLLSLLRGHRLKRLLKRMLDPNEFLSDFGIRALSRIHRDQPYQFHTDHTTLTVDYQPGESTSSLFGGNSNWRGPIWMPVNYMLIESLRRFHQYYGDDFKVECPTGSGTLLTLNQIADELSVRLCKLVLRDEQGKRPVFGDQPLMQNDPHFRDHLLFYEYFHGDSGRGVGASHQTGWTGLLATLLSQWQDKDSMNLTMTPRSVEALV